MKNLITLEKHIFDFPESFTFPPEYNESIFIPAYGEEHYHYYYLVDFAAKKIFFWEVNTKQIVSKIKEGLKESYDDCIPLNQKSLDIYLELLFYDHSVDFYLDKIYISFVGGNFILELNKYTNDYELICDSKLTKIYSSTNMIQDGKIYFTRWDIEEGFQRVRKNFEECVNLEIGYYDIEHKEFKILHSFIGTDDIHTTGISECGNYVLALEMCQEPNKRYPRDIENAPPEVMREVLASQLRESHLYTYDIKNQKLLETLVMGNSPAHIELDTEDHRYIYVAQHNNSVVTGGINSFGHAYLNKIRIDKDKLIIEKKYNGENLFRTPSNRLTKYRNRQLLLCPGYSSQIHIIDTEEMKLLKHILLTKTTKQLDYTNGPAKYPSFTADRTPYTVHGVDNTSYLYLVSIWNITTFDFETETTLGKLVFNVNAKPILGMGHSTKISYRNS